MANIKELRLRIKSVAGIAKITSAMEMVASMKLRKAQAAAIALRPYTAEIQNLIDHLAEFVGQDASLPLFERRTVKSTGVLVLSSDRGLCGAYNSNLLATFHKLERAALAKDPDRKFKIYCYGKKGYRYLYKRGYEIEKFFVDPPLDKVDFAAAKRISGELVAAFEGHFVDEVCAQSDTGASGQGNTKLKEQLQEHGKIADFWIYDDLDLGFADAKNTGKPLLVVFR